MKNPLKKIDWKHLGILTGLLLVMCVVVTWITEWKPDFIQAFMIWGGILTVLSLIIAWELIFPTEISNPSPIPPNCKNGDYVSFTGHAAGVRDKQGYYIRHRDKNYIVDIDSGKIQEAMHYLRVEKIENHE